jgi:hypothetical protein
MQNREELRQKGQNKSKKTNDVLQEGEKYHVRKGGNKYCFRTKI